MSRQGRARRLLIEGLRAVADFYESNPTAYYDGLMLSLCMYITCPAAGRIMAEMVRIFGESKHSCNGAHVTLSKEFSSKVKLEIFAPCQAGNCAANCREIWSIKTAAPRCVPDVRYADRRDEGQRGEKE
jgi:hypothetical protein